MSTATKVLDIVRTDRTFERVEHRGREAWCGKCLHCDTHLYVGLDGRPISRATIEHVLARHHGGTDDLENLALAQALAGLDPRDPSQLEAVARLYDEIGAAATATTYRARAKNRRAR